MLEDEVAQTGQGVIVRRLRQFDLRFARILNSLPVIIELLSLLD
jgi:hypothetical protein